MSDRRGHGRRGGRHRASARHLACSRGTITAALPRSLWLRRRRLRLRLLRSLLSCALPQQPLRQIGPCEVSMLVGG